MNAAHDHLSATFLALSDPTRRAILTRLGRRRMRVTQLAAPFAISLAAVSKHVRALERARLVMRQVAGREHWIAANPAALGAAQDWIARHRRFWNERLDALQALLEAPRPRAKRGGRR
jgi:DNA-binding transcriptional ArsR family regulator